MLYFDHNATTPLSAAARDAWLAAAEKFIGNPSSPHRLGARADAALTEAREELATLLGCAASEVVFTSGATESNNTVLHHAASAMSASDEIWVSALEHPCVLEPARAHFGKLLKWIPINRDGVVELDWLADALRSARPALVAIMAANNETGALQPWREVLALCRAREVPFFCDAAQWLGKQPSLGLGDCDWLTGSAHKFGGPRGVGFLKVPSALGITPLLRGGPQEEKRRAGTENVPGALAMVAALQERETHLSMAGAGDQRSAARNRFERELLAALPGAEIIAANVPRLWNTSCALMPEADCQSRWVVKLDKLGAAVSTGSACASGKEEPSHVLRAMGLAPAEAARALRFSSGWETKASDWAALVEKLRTVAGEPLTRAAV